MIRLAIVITLIAGPAAAQKLDIDENSQKACYYRSDVKVKLLKLNDPGRMKNAGSEESLRSDLNSFCMYQEREAADALSKIGAAVPEQLIYDCDRRAKARGDDYSRHSYAAMLECFNDQLTKLSAAALPRGSASIYLGGNEYRFWTTEECMKARQDGQVCVAH